jgi:hypothetical protein
MNAKAVEDVRPGGAGFSCRDLGLKATSTPHIHLRTMARHDYGLMSTCPHSNVRCLNEFELIRKYRCESCGAVMMCACDESVGRKFLAQQLEFGVDSKAPGVVLTYIGDGSPYREHMVRLAAVGNPAKFAPPVVKPTSWVAFREPGGSTPISTRRRRTRIS